MLQGQDTARSEAVRRVADNQSDPRLTFRDFDFNVDASRFERQHVPAEEVRLMVVDAERGSIKHDRFVNLPSYFARGDLLLWNRTGISRSRLHGHTRSGRALDLCFLLLEEGGDVWDAVVLSPDGSIEDEEFVLGRGAISGRLLERTQEGGGAADDTR